MCERARSVAVFRVNPIDDGGQLQQATEPKFVRSFWKVTLCVESLKGFPPLSLSLSLSALLSIDHDLGLKGADTIPREGSNLSQSLIRKNSVGHVYKLYSDRSLSGSWHLLASGQMGVYARSLYVLFSIEGNFLFFSFFFRCWFELRERLIVTQSDFRIVAR